MFINQNKNQNNLYFMRLALEQAKRTLGNTKDNPAVGCVITKNNTLISAGSTSLSGRPHAEHNAINFSKTDLNNSTLYATLEPCSHYGKTSPCVKKIINNKIKKVFFSIKDPDPRSFNKSAKHFKKKRITFNTGIYSKEISNFYRSYLIYKIKKLPFLTCKLAVSKDFFTINKKKKWITNQYSRSRVHLMRSYHDCVMTSSETIIKDNPLLSCRVAGLEKRSPSKIILDNKLRIPINSKIIKDNSKYNTIIFYNKINRKKIKSLNNLGIKLYKIPLDNENNLDLEKVLIKTKDLGFSRIFLESGIKLSTSFFKMNLVNDFRIFISNIKIKKRGYGSVKSYFKSFLRYKKKKIEKVNLFGEKLISYKIK